jgi:rod shape-determining protein MreC
MRELLYRFRVPLLFVALVALTSATLAADRRSLRTLRPGRDDLSTVPAALLDIAVPLQGLLTAPVDLARGLVRRYVALTGLRSENDALRTRLSELEDENLQYREALLESAHLDRIAEVRSELELPMLPAQVASRDLSPWYRTVLVDRGREHDVRSGMPAVTEDGIVGLVTATSPHAARVMLLLDRQSAVDVMVQRSRVRGIVRGLGSDEREHEYTVRGEDVQVGDMVITSGLGGVYPKGLRIGEVVSVSAAGSQLLQRARIRPAVDFGRLEQLFVVLWRSPTLELLSGDTDVPGPTSAPPRP